MGSYRLHKWFYRILRPTFGAYLGRKFRLEKKEAPELPETFIMVSNHVTNYDPFVIGLTCRRHMYFVATEHILNLGWKSFFIKHLVDPIPRPKGGNASGAVREILRRLRDKKNVVLFAEGNCSWDGCSQDFPEATGKMVRTARVPLVTFRLSGGYFAYPRWAYSFRKGPFTGDVVHVYSSEELRAMTPEEINAHIAEDIYEDAYAREEQAPARYPGKKLAKGIEHALVLCPSCRKFDRIRSEDSRFYCSCGLSGTYDEYGKLSGSGFSFTTIKDWDAWQKGEIARLSADTEEAFTEDDDMQLLEINGHKRSETARGQLSLNGSVLRIGELSFPLSELEDLSVRTHGIVSFSLKTGGYYEIKRADRRNYSGRKYKLLYDALTK